MQLLGPLRQRAVGQDGVAEVLERLVHPGRAPCVERPARGWSGGRASQSSLLCSSRAMQRPSCAWGIPVFQKRGGFWSLPSTAIDSPGPPSLGGEAFPRCPDGQLRQVSDVRGGRRLRPGPRHRAAGLDQLLVRSEQCFMNSGEIHPCRTVCPYQQDNDRFFTDTAGPDRLLHVDTRLGERVRRTRRGSTGGRRRWG